MSKRPSATGPENALMQVVVKAAYDYRMARNRCSRSRLAYVVAPDETRHTLAKAFVVDTAKLEAVRLSTVALIQICAAMRPVHRRALWLAFRQGWRTAGTVIKQGGVR